MSAPEPLARRDDGLEISLDPGRLHRDLVHHWLAEESYWAAGRSREVFDRSLAGSLVFGVYEGPGEGARQLAFARAVTDGATFAWVCDVFVDEAARGRGVGTWLMDVLVAELLERRGIARLVLATRDAHGVYARSGFAPLDVPSRWMEIDRRPTRGADAGA